MGHSVKRVPWMDDEDDRVWDADDLAWKDEFDEDSVEEEDEDFQLSEWEDDDSADDYMNDEPAWKSGARSGPRLSDNDSYLEKPSRSQSRKRFGNRRRRR